MRIFLSYRRDDTSGFAGRLADGLVERFGERNVFRDIDSIPAGTNFVRTIDEAVQSSDVLIAVMGRDWLTATDGSGRRRLDNPDDFVRLEIAAALERKIPVVPVLVEGASMPPPSALPPPLAGLSEHNALEISDSRWDYDVDRLISAIQPGTAGAPARKTRPVGLIVGALVTAVALVVFGIAFLGTGDDDGADVRLVRPDTGLIGYGEPVEIEATGLREGTVWFVLQPEGEEHYQPDPRPIRAGNDRWVGAVYAGDEGNVGLRFSLHVVVASEAASNAFTAYLDQAMATGSYPGFKRLPEGSRSVASFTMVRR